MVVGIAGVLAVTAAGTPASASLITPSADVPASAAASRATPITRDAVEYDFWKTAIQPAAV
ncbi:hypothetical protein Prum_063630 [Phytohabitans rumicis]|uniref:Uncharacterized protein n=1 Tax=Phytohabitans rumicis TaxID=1076125 RepID=A0A6V8LD68_9ACTN|nr:hypothetical protein Prum_063630 [Phytohabitans rumicis]